MPATTKRSRMELLIRFLNRNWKGNTINMTATVIAQVATTHLGFLVNPKVVCQLLRDMGMKFVNTPHDPPTRARSSLDLIRARIDHLEQRLKILENGVTKKNGRS